MNANPAPRQQTSTLAGKYLTFALGEEIYGLEILKVREIVAMSDITRVPRTPDFVRGVINLRGRIVPVIDLRQKLGMPPAPEGTQPCMIVVRAAGADVAVIVDRFLEVREVSAGEAEPLPGLGEDLAAEFLLGLVKNEKTLTLLLDIERLLGAPGVACLGLPEEKGDSPHLPERPSGCCAQMGTVPFFPAADQLAAEVCRA